MASFLCLGVFVSFLLHVCLGLFACFGYSCIVTTTSVRLTTVMTKDKMMTTKGLHGKCKTITKSTKTLSLFPSSQKKKKKTYLLSVASRINYPSTHTTSHLSLRSFNSSHIRICDQPSSDDVRSSTSREQPDIPLYLAMRTRDFAFSFVNGYRTLESLGSVVLRPGPLS
jgi:hypothetical protein